MKKFLTALLFACSLTLVGAAIGCDDNSEESSQSTSSNAGTQAETRTVTFVKGEGYSYIANVGDDGKIAEGNQLIFKVELGAFYTGNLLVCANGESLSADAEGTYSVTVGKEDITVTVEGVRKDVSNMVGSGSMEDAFVVTKPIDLLYIAEQVNKGNQAYCQGAYLLANDIDCKGEELQVIGDRSTEQSYFSGSFACWSDPETGEYERYTISNFTINSTDSGYVGLFGAVFADMTVTSSGLFYGIRLDNFTINAGVKDIADSNKTLSCGGLIGYGVGANAYLCDATNGTINVTADKNYFAFVGGLIGYQKGFYESSYGMYFPTELSYCKTDVDVNILDGVALYAGGIVGYMATNYPYGATAAVHNSYALGSVSGALRSGGIAGGLGQYTVVSNCYASGAIGAVCKQSASSELTLAEYTHAYAGGIVGYAENDTIAHDSFFNGTLSAVAASQDAYEHTHYAVAGGDEAATASVDAQAYVLLNCIQNADLSDTEYLTQTLGWQNYNWIFTENKLPEINYEASDAVQARLTVVYLNTSDQTTVTYKANKEYTYTYFDTSVQSLNAYTPIGTFISNGSLPLYAAADQDGYRSYGYFFDKECTRPVPYSYLPMRDVTLYMAFADVTPVVGEYKLVTGNHTQPLHLVFKADGTLTYTDGATTSTASYAYDGETILILGARLARYYDGAIVIDETDTTKFTDTNFDLYRYETYNFLGKLTADGIELYDDTYFTETAPLRANKRAFVGEYYVVNGTTTTYYEFYGDKAIVEVVSENDYSKKEYAMAVSEGVITLTGNGTLTVNIADLKEYDAFKGSWVKSATVNKIYTFDGMGNWSYNHVAYTRTANGYTESSLDKASGTYTVVGNGITFTHGTVDYTASFNSDGHLEIKGNGVTQIYHADNSYVGTWRFDSNDESLRYTLSLQGINEQGYGFAAFTMADGYVYNFLYEVAEKVSGVDTVVLVFYDIDEAGATEKSLFYGYAVYTIADNTLHFTQIDDSATTGYTTDILYLNDDYYGEWISDIEGLENLSFDGKGLYSHLDINGRVTLANGNRATYVLDSALNGRFTDDGKTYKVSYDEDAKQIAVSLSASGELQRKDDLAGVKFVDLDGNRYLFDGRSPLGDGKLTVNGTTAYTYAKAENGYTVTDGKGGNITKPENANYYLLTLDGKEIKLYIENDFMGEWAITNQYTTFRIGPTDTNGNIKAVFKGSDVELTYLDPTTLTFEYREASGMPVTYYVFVIADSVTNRNVLVFSEFTNLTSGEYFICSKVDELFGTWEWSRDNGKTTLKFDGVTCGFVNGCAQLILQLNHSTVVTDYYYRIRNGRILMWSKEALAERTWYFRLDLLDASNAEGKDIFNLVGGSGEKVLLRTEVDGLYMTEAVSPDGTEKYFFDYDLTTNKSTILVNGSAKYTYVIKAYNDNSTAEIEVVDIATSKKYKATLDYSNQSNITLTIGEEIVETPAS